MDTKRLRIFVVLSFLTFALTPSSLLAQQQYGQLQIQVVDPTQAVMPGAPVELTSPALIRPITGTADGRGMFIATTLPPGLYTITVRATGFRAAVVENVTVEVGRTYSVEVICEVGAVEETVTVEAGAAVIDVVRSESATVFRGDSLVATPGGRDYTGFVNLLPSVNINENSGIETFTGTGGGHKGRTVRGISVDGSSGAENVFYVDGIDTTSMYTGLANQGLRTEVVQEFQIKTSGYEAEFGGAMGGVLSVVTKSGGNDFHGQVFYYYSGSSLSSDPRQRLRLVPGVSPDAADYTLDPKDPQNTNEAGVIVGGPIVPDKAWFFGAAMPTWTHRNRETIVGLGGTSEKFGVFDQYQRLYNYNARLDFQPVEKLRLSTSYSSDHYRWRGGLPSFDGLGGADFDYDRQGFEYPSYTWSNSITATLSPKFVVDLRYGLNALNTVQFLKTVEPRWFHITGSGAIGYLAADPLFTSSVSYNYGINDGYATNQNFQKKNYFSSGASWLASAGGQHNIKLGYQWTRLSQAVDAAYPWDYLRFYWGESFEAFDGSTLNSTCVANGVTWNPCGYYSVRDPFGEQANIHTDRHALYFQDGWTIGGRLTINAGIRVEKEAIPSFSDLPEFAGSAYQWGYSDKVAPRLGASVDVFGDRKLKIFGSWGWFFDAMKLEMANGSFGGFKWLSNYILMTQATIDAIEAAQSFSVLGDLSAGPGAPYPSGNYPGTYVETTNWRIPSFDTLEPDLKPMRMSDYVAGMEWEVRPNWVASARFVYKHLDEAIEDVGGQSAAGEVYFIANPGRGISVTEFQALGLPPTPRPKRNYQLIEFRLRHPFSNRWRGDFSYAYSRLRGIYSGLGSSDENGRLSPNVDRDFDLWFLNYDASGNLIDGPLSTDVPHQVKINAAYETPFGLEIGGFQRIMSGTPITRQGYIHRVELIVQNRGSDGRNPTWGQTDLYLRQKFHPFQDETKSIEFSANFINLFNQKTGLRTRRLFNRINSTGVFNPDVAPIADPSVILNGYDWECVVTCETAASIFAGDPSLFLPQAQWDDPTATDPQCWDALAWTGVPGGAGCGSGKTMDPRFGQLDRFQERFTLRLGVRFIF